MKTLNPKLLNFKGLLTLLLAIFLCSSLFSFGGHNCAKIKVLSYKRCWLEGHVIKYGWQYQAGQNIWQWIKFDWEFQQRYGTNPCVNISRFKPYAEVRGCCTYNGGWSGVCYGGTYWHGFPFQWYNYKAGEEFIADTIPPVEGVSRAEVNFQTTVTNGPGNTVIITLGNFSGSLRATAASWHGTSCAMIGFQAPPAFDSASIFNYTIPPGSILFSTGFRIEHGTPIFMPPFTASDFVVSTQPDSSGTTVLQIVPVPGLIKSFTVAGNDSTVFMKTQLGAGYGHYNNSAITTPSQIPTLTEWGLILLAVLLVGSGTVYIVRRQRRLSLTQ